MADLELKDLSQKLDKELWDAYEKRGNYGNLRGLKETADDEFKGALALIRVNAPKEGTVPEIDAWVRRDEEYLVAMQAKSNRYADWTAAELKMKILFALKEKYQTDAKMDRDIDRAHR